MCRRLFKQDQFLFGAFRLMHIARTLLEQSFRFVSRQAPPLNPTISVSENAVFSFSTFVAPSEKGEQKRPLGVPIEVRSNRQNATARVE
jgi:hypothetical protein